MPPKDVLQARMVHVIEEHTKSLERMGWKNMDDEEFADAFLGFLKGLIRVVPYPTKTQIRVALAAAKLSLSAPEAALLTTKTRSAISYARKRGRDAGSGKYLPSSVKALLREWARLEGGKKEKKKEKAMIGKAALDEKTPSNMAIRDVFGLGQKQQAAKITISDSSSETALDDRPDMPSSSGAASSSMPAGSLQDHPYLLPPRSKLGCLDIIEKHRFFCMGYNWHLLDGVLGPLSPRHTIHLQTPYHQQIQLILLVNCCLMPNLAPNQLDTPHFFSSKLSGLHVHVGWGCEAPNF